MLPARRHVGLFWRLFVPNAAVLGVACVVLMVQPPNGRVPVLVAGLAVMLAVDVLILRRAVAPLLRLTDLMRRVDPLAPGERVEPTGPPSEVTVLAEAFNAMLDRVEAERSSSGRRALSELEAERRRLAAELHDEIGQSLTGLMLSLSRAAEAPNDPRLELHRAADQVSGIIGDVRAIARGLRPEALDDLGLPSALHNLCEELSARTGLAVERRISRDLPALPSETELVIYRVVQESLTNVVRHAEATRAEVTLEYRAPLIVAEVVDDGGGRPPEPLGGSGIRGMRERAVLVRGDLTIFAPPGGGLGVRLLVPCESDR